MINVTAEFQVFRDLLRVVWNLGMRTHPDSDLEFLDVERSMFVGLFFSRFSQGDPVRAKSDGTDFYPQIIVASPEKSALILRESGWVKHELEGKLEGAFVRLFDFDWTGDAYRDFRYVECVCNDGNGTLALVDASTAKISFRDH